MTWEGKGIFEVSSADPDSTSPVWVDLTPYVNDVVMVPRLAGGRQNDLERTDDGQLQVVLNNGDDRFTYGSADSPYAAWWAPGRRCRYRDLIGATAVPLFSGYLQPPTEGLITAGVEQRVALSAIDRMGRHGLAPQMVSTLAEHIKYHGGPSLQGYWPYNEGVPPFYDVSPIGQPPIVNKGTRYNGGNDAVSGSFEVRSGIPVGNDDASVAYCDGALSSSGALTGRLSVLRADVSIPFGVGQVVTMIMWLWPDIIPTEATLFFAQLKSTSDLNCDFNAVSNSDFTFFADGPMGGAITGRRPPAQAWTPVALRFGYNPAVYELWVGRDRYTSALAGIPPVTDTITRVDAGVGWRGGIGHVQLYVGAAADWTYTDYVAQIDMAWAALDRQTTGDRIRLISQYAGVPDSELTQVDKGQSIMQTAMLAGQTPLDALRDAERTEQGLLYADGSGNTVFRDRRTLYNI